jgi:hypothetical protein
MFSKLTEVLDKKNKAKNILKTQTKKAFYVLGRSVSHKIAK